MTAKGKITAANIRTGMFIVVRNAGAFLAPVSTKTGGDNVIATVTSIDQQSVSGRKNYYYVFTTDLGTTVPVAPGQTFWDASELTGRTLVKLGEQTESLKAQNHVLSEIGEEDPLPVETERVTVTVVNGTDGLMHVHKPGCRDIARTRANGVFDMPAANEEELAGEIFSDFIPDEMSLEEALWDTKVYPCVVWPKSDTPSETEYLTAEPNGIRLAESVKELVAGTGKEYLADNAWQNFVDLAISAPTEAARAYWAIRANERVFLT